MEEWRGYMNWPLNPDWKCQTCGGRSLIWGMQHAACRCDTCHTEYYMRDARKNIIDTPICMLKDEYLVPAMIGYAKFHKPISEWSDSEWNEAIKAIA